MKIKLDFWITPDGYTGANTEHTGKAHHVKGTIEIVDNGVEGLIEALCAALMRFTRRGSL